MRIARIVLWFFVVTFAAVGLTCAFFPQWMAGLVEIALPTDTARVDFIAMYGGFEIGLAVFLWICTRKDEHVRLGLVASGCALSGLAVSRLVGVALAERVQLILYLALLAEVACSMLAFWAARVKAM